MRYREIGELFGHKNKYLMIAHGNQCSECTFGMKEVKDCPAKYKCLPAYREDDENVVYQDVTDLLTHVDKVLIDHGFFTELSKESKMNLLSEKESTDQPT